MSKNDSKIQSEADAVVVEIVKALTAAIAAGSKTLSAAGLGEWRGKLLTAVKAHLSATPKPSWPAARAKVLSVATDMGTIAVIISGTDPSVTKNRLHAAFRASKAHVNCPTASGSGAWCDFSV